MKKVIHIPAKCIGCMACVGLAPDLFEADLESGLSKLIKGQKEGEKFVRIVSDEQVPDMLESACSGDAIKVEDVT